MRGRVEEDEVSKVKSNPVKSTRKQAPARGGNVSPLPITKQEAKEIQSYGTLARLPLSLGEKACRDSVTVLNQLLADTITIRDMYKKHHWQLVGHTFYQLHLLFDKHY